MRNGYENKAATAELRGTVVFYETARAFGFIRRDDHQPDVVASKVALRHAGLASLGAGDRVAFDVTAMRLSRFAELSAQYLDDAAAATPRRSCTHIHEKVSSS